MEVEAIAVEVGYAKADKQVILQLQVPIDATIEQTIRASGILEAFPEIDLNRNKVGVFSEICPLHTQVCAGQRIEIYRPLLQNPMENRRRKLNR